MRTLSSEWNTVSFIALYASLLSIGIAVASIAGFVLMEGIGVLRSLLLSRNSMESAAVKELTLECWSTRLLHAEPGKATTLVESIKRHIRSLENGQALDVNLVVPDISVTSKQTKLEVASMHGMFRLPSRQTDQGLSIVPVKGPPSGVNIPSENGVHHGKMLLLSIAMTFLVVTLFAWPISDAEQAACILAKNCANRPANYNDAVFWLATMLVNGDPAGLEPGTWAGRLGGLLVTVMGITLIAFVITTLLQRIGTSLDLNLESLIGDLNLEMKAAAAAGAVEQPQGRPSARSSDSGSAFLSKWIAASIAALIGLVVGTSLGRRRRKRRSRSDDRRSGGEGL
ncbi:hypothetical protein [Nonomuraea sp. NPDC049725]|uniref:hypothetical protein n=1 Tax=Nonomuraea sp. NPDC049725 TaxID=3154508 RepID=UPI0034264BB3